MKIIMIIILILNMLLRMLLGFFLPEGAWNSMLTGNAPGGSLEYEDTQEPIEYGDGEDFTIIVPEGHGSAGF